MILKYVCKFTEIARIIQLKSLSFHLPPKQTHDRLQIYLQSVLLQQPHPYSKAIEMTGAAKKDTEKTLPPTFQYLKYCHLDFQETVKISCKVPFCQRLFSCWDYFCHSSKSTMNLDKKPMQKQEKPLLANSCQNKEEGRLIHKSSELETVLFTTNI